MEEKQLIHQAQKGSTPALEQLIQHWYQSIFAYFYKNTRQYHLSADLTQETFLRMVAAMGSYRPWGNFRSWLFTIAANCLKNHWRSFSRRPEEPLPDDYPQTADPFCQPSQAADLEAALDTLPPEQREVIILRYYHDFSIREIGKITGANESTVKARLRYGLAKLRKELTGYEED